MQIGRYALPSSLIGGVEVLEEKERMTKNMKDFVIMTKVNDNIKHASRLLQYVRDEATAKKEDRFNRHQ